MGKTKRREKPKFPRGTYRARWEMPHKCATDYVRRQAKYYVEEELEELEPTPAEKLEEEQKLKEEEEAAAWEQIFFCWTCGDFVESKEDRLCPNCLRNYPMLDPGY